MFLFRVAVGAFRLPLGGASAHLTAIELRSSSAGLFKWIDFTCEGDK